jgi:hypothetical protein
MVPVPGSGDNPHPKAVTAVRLPRPRTAAATLLWSLTASALTAFSLFGAIRAIVADTTYRSIQSPNGAHRLLILDSSFLLLGRHDIYEPACGPLWNHRAGARTRALADAP